MLLSIYIDLLTARLNAEGDARVFVRGGIGYGLKAVLSVESVPLDTLTLQQAAVQTDENAFVIVSES